MMEINICSIVTKDAYAEFKILKKSIEMFHQCVWYIAADNYVADRVAEDSNIKAYRLVKDKVFLHGVEDVKNNIDFYEMLRTKFEIMKIALCEKCYVMFLDTDMIFLSRIETQLIDLISKKYVDIILTPHYTRDKVNENRVGYFNAGMFMVNNINLIEEWNQVCLSEENQYYEQPPLEKIIENYRCIILPINYNVGWWRFKKSFSEFRYNELAVDDNQILLCGHPIVNLHIHTVKKLGYSNYGKLLFEKIISLSNELDKEENSFKILHYINNIINSEKNANEEL